MNKILRLLLALCLAPLGAVAQDFPRYGYAPEVCDSMELKYQGIGENGFVAAYICLDPQTDPAVDRLKGHKVLGVRCFMSHEYDQQRQGRSLIQWAEGSPEAEPTQVVCRFDKGWNNIYFDEPVTIGEQPLYVGLQVFETLGDRYPIGAYDAVNVPQACWFNLSDQGWKQYDDRGALLIFAILDDEAAPALERSVFAQTAHSPLVVEPSKPFAGKVSFTNCSAAPVSKLTLQMLGQGDEQPHEVEVSFEEPLAPHEGRVVPMSIYTGSGLGTNQWLDLSVSRVDGEDAQAVMPGRTWHYVTEDAFTRVPLVEEFTSQYCTACPFMFYFLDLAMEAHTLSDLVYVSHHSGFQKDAFTQPVDEELLYFFGPAGDTFNPAVMYDRVVPVGAETPILTAQVAETEPYASALAQAAVRPAMAGIDIALNETEEGLGCTVSGRVNKEMAASGRPVYLSVYLVEDSIGLDKYPQKGLNDEGAPEDLIERFKHNGVKRVNYCTVATGDELKLDADNKYSVDFAPVAWDAAWVRKNCRLVAYVHLMDKQNLKFNEVLNAAHVRLGGDASAIEAVPQEAPLRFSVDAAGRLRSSQPCAQLRLFNAAGQALDASAPLPRGVYVVQGTARGTGQTQTQKLIVR